MFETGMGGDGRIWGQSVPCPGCDDGFIEHGQLTCQHCGAEIEPVEAAPAEDVETWDELLDVVIRR